MEWWSSVRVRKMRLQCSIVVRNDVLEATDARPRRCHGMLSCMRGRINPLQLVSVVCRIISLTERLGVLQERRSAQGKACRWTSLWTLLMAHLSLQGAVTVQLRCDALYYCSPVCHVPKTLTLPGVLHHVQAS